MRTSSCKKQTTSFNSHCYSESYFIAKESRLKECAGGKPSIDKRDRLGSIIIHGSMNTGGTTFSNEKPWVGFGRPVNHIMVDLDLSEEGYYKSN